MVAGVDITISSRGAEPSAALVAATRRKIGRLARFVEGMDTAEVHFSEEKNPRIVEKDICEVVIEGHGQHVHCKVAASRRIRRRRPRRREARAPADQAEEQGRRPRPPQLTVFGSTNKWSDATISVLVCDDAALARRQLTVALEASDHIEVVAEAADGDTALAEAIESTPDVIWMGLHLGGLAGVRLHRLDPRAGAGGPLRGHLRPRRGRGSRQGAQGRRVCASCAATRPRPRPC